MHRKGIAVSASQAASKWIAADPRHKSSGFGHIRLICFPYAGGGASPYYAWTRHLHPDIELLRVQLPGREIRLREAAFVDLSSLVETLAAELLPWLDRPFAFFGHSMGALVAFETAAKLRKTGGPKPSHVFVSSFRAPHLPNTDPISADVSDDRFLEYLVQYEGIPEAILSSSELLEIFLPILRADFRVLGSYRARQRTPLECPITLFGSLSDPKIDREEMEAWEKHTTDIFTSHYFQGGHFYIHENYSKVIGFVNRYLLSNPSSD